jgi:ankyrin repeat protein
MTEIDDIRDSIELATRARNVELAKLWLEWQRRRNPSLLLDHILIGVASRCLEIPRFMGTPSREVIAQIVRISAGSRFLDGLKYAFEFLSPSEKAGFVDRYWSAGVGSPDRAITSFFCQSDLGWRQALLAALQLGNTALVAQTLARVPSGESLNFVRARTTPLVIAAAYGNMDNLNLLLSVPGLDPMMPDLTGTSPFVTACRSGDFAVIQRLAEFCGESVSESECEVNAGFFWASNSPIIDARFELIPFFSRFPSLDPNFLVWGSSAFISAAASGHVPLLESLLAFPGIDVNARDAAGVTALTRAIECEAVACVSLLLADPRVDPHVATISNWYPLSRAVATDSLELVELLLASDRFDLGVVGGQALATSIVWDDPDMSAVLIGRPDLDVNGCFATGPWDLPPRLKAICRERRDRLPPISERPPCCLMLAIDQDNVALVNAIIAHPTFDPVRSHLAHAVFRALRANVGAIAQALLGNQANMAQRGPRGRSLLAAAIGCNSRHLELIGRHPAFNISDQSPRQCVHAMARAQSLDAFEFLSRFPEVDLASPLPHGTNGFPDEVFRARRDWNRSKATEGLPPVFSLRYYHMTVSKLLANPRVDGTQRGKHGQTILFEVVREAPSSAFVGQLFGVDPNATDRHQNTLVHCAALTRPPPPIWRVDMLQCDWTIRNENADAIWEMANSRARRRIYT